MMRAPSARISGLRLRRSPGLAACRNLTATIRWNPASARPSHPSLRVTGIACRDSSIRTVVRAKNSPPYSRAAATAFHRLPVRGVSC